MVPYLKLELFYGSYREVFPNGKSTYLPLMAKVTLSNEATWVSQNQTICVPLDYVCIDHLSHLKVIQLLRKQKVFDEKSISNFAYMFDVDTRKIKQEANEIFENAKKSV